RRSAEADGVPPVLSIKSHGLFHHRDSKAAQLEIAQIIRRDRSTGDRTSGGEDMAKDCVAVRYGLAIRQHENRNAAPPAELRDRHQIGESAGVPNRAPISAILPETELTKHRSDASRKRGGIQANQNHPTLRVWLVSPTPTKVL